jgi:ribosomal protein L32
MRSSRQQQLVDAEEELRGTSPHAERRTSRWRRGSRRRSSPRLAAAHLVADQHLEGVLHRLPHRLGGAEEGVAAPEHLVGGLEEPQALVDATGSGRPAAEDIEGEAEGDQLPAPRAVTDLRRRRRGVPQRLNGALVLLAVLLRELLETGVDGRDEVRQGIDDLLGRPEVPLDESIHGTPLLSPCGSPPGSDSIARPSGDREERDSNEARRVASRG